MLRNAVQERPTMPPGTALKEVSGGGAVPIAVPTALCHHHHHCKSHYKSAEHDSQEHEDACPKDSISSCSSKEDAEQHQREKARKTKKVLSELTSSRDSNTSNTAETAQEGTMEPGSFASEDSLNTSLTDTLVSTLQSFAEGTPRPHLARRPSDPLEELSAILAAFPAKKGRLYAYLTVYATLGRHGYLAMAKGALPLPPPSATCSSALAGLVVRPWSREARKQTLMRFRAPEPTLVATPGDGLVRAVMAYVLGFIFDQAVQGSDVLGRVSRNTAFSCPCARVPGISFVKYVQRALQFLPATKELYVVALIYIDRVLGFNSDLEITFLNMHRLFIVALVVASKYLDDFYFTNRYVSRVAGISNEHLNKLEYEFLTAIHFTLGVDPDTYKRYATPFWNLVGISSILPLGVPVEQPPYSGPPLLRSSYSAIDEMFLHIQRERRHVKPTKRPRQQNHHHHHHRHHRHHHHHHHHHHRCHNEGSEPPLQQMAMDAAYVDHAALAAAAFATTVDDEDEHSSEDCSTSTSASSALSSESEATRQHKTHLLSDIHKLLTPQPLKRQANPIVPRATTTLVAATNGSATGADQTTPTPTPEQDEEEDEHKVEDGKEDDKSGDEEHEDDKADDKDDDGEEEEGEDEDRGSNTICSSAPTGSPRR